jgi:hypothetical protein
LLQGVFNQQRYAQLARGFSAGSAVEQLGLARVRDRWKATGAGCEALPRAVELGVCPRSRILAWVDQGLTRLGLADDAWLGGAGGGVGTGGFGANPNDPGSGCRASAGCTDYKAGSGTYTDEDYNYDTGSYDYSYSQ